MTVFSFKRAMLLSTGLSVAMGVAIEPAAAQGVDRSDLPPASAPSSGSAAEPAGDAQSTGASTSAKGLTDAGIAEILVTAERRSQSLQRTAASVTVRDGDGLQREGKFTLRQVLEDVPGVSAVDFNAQLAAGSDSAGTNVTIRGVGSNTAPGTVSSVPASAIYVDGVYEGVGSSYDINRVEVLRGPQGTLYGRSATAGVMSFQTRAPILDEWSGDLTGEIGNYQLRHYTGALNVPIGDKIALRVSGDQYARNGFYNGEGGAVNRTSGRAKLLIKPSDELTMVFGVAIQDNEVNTGGTEGTFTVADGVRFNNVLPITTSHDRFWQYWADIKLELGAVTINYLPALRTWNQNAVQSVVGPGLLTLRQTIKTPLDYFHTQELRFSGDIGGKLNWLGGVFYYDNKLRNTNDVRWASSGGLLANSATERRTTNIGFYGDATYHLSSVWRVTGGMRWDYTKVQTDQVYTTNVNYLCNTSLAGPDCPAGYTGAGFPEDRRQTPIGGSVGTSTFRNFTFRARVEHDLTPANLLYATVSSGFIPGDVQVATGSNDSGQQVPVIRHYNSETLTAFEVGSKNRFLNGALQLNGDVFYYRYGGFQKTVQPNPIDASSTFVATVPARVWGAELEGVIVLSSDDRLSFNYSYVGSRYKDRPAEFVAAVSQNFVTGVAPHTVNLNYGHTFHFGEATLMVEGSGRYTSAYDRADISPSFVSQLEAAGIDRDLLIRQPDEITANLTSTLTLGDGRFSITGYIRNLFDNRYISTINLQSVTPTLTASADLADPRTVGVIVSVRF